MSPGATPLRPGGRRRAVHHVRRLPSSEPRARARGCSAVSPSECERTWSLQVSLGLAPEDAAIPGGHDSDARRPSSEPRARARGCTTGILVVNLVAAELQVSLGLAPEDASGPATTAYPSASLQVSLGL